MSWIDKPSRAEQLAAWIELGALGPDRFGLVYQRLGTAAGTTPWTLLSLRPDPILEACRVAQRLDFISELAAEVALAEQLIGRDVQDINALLVVLGDLAVTEAVIDPALGAPGLNMYDAVGRAMAASALVTVAGVPAGSAFLVAPDLVLTAGHVVLATETDAAGREVFSSKLRKDVRFLFRSVRDRSIYDQEVLPASPDDEPDGVALPFADPPNRLLRELCQESALALDFALVRLARQVTDVPHLDIQAPPTPRKEALWVVGFWDGATISFPTAKVSSIDATAARIFHLANTTPGMSGSCCLGPDGKPFALHEGSLAVLDENGHQVVTDGKPQKINRAVSLNSIRARLSAAQRDPLTQRPRAPKFAFRDRRTLERWRIEARRLAGTALDAWDKAVQERLGFSPTAPDLPAFHPWFPRQALETWVHQAPSKANERVRYVNGPDGAGKSFSARIVEEKLNHPDRDLIVLDPTVITKWDWEDALTRLGGSVQGEIFRTVAGALRHDMIPEIVARFGKVGGAVRLPDQPLFIAIDFERDTSGSSRLRFENTPWPPFVLELARHPWTRLLLIGLSQAERTDFDDMFFNDAQATAVSTDDIDLQPIGGLEVVEFFKSAFTAQGQAIRRADLAKIGADWANPAFHNTRPEMQTVEAVLFAMERTRQLWGTP